MRYHGKVANAEDLRLKLFQGDTLSLRRHQADSETIGADASNKLFYP